MTEKRLDFRQALIDAKTELRVIQEEIGECLTKQEQLEVKLVALRQVIGGFSSALGQRFDEADELGLTDAVRQAFNTYDKDLEPTAVRARLEEIGFQTKKYGNFMASVHTVLNRLVKYGEIKQIMLPGNKITYMSMRVIEEKAKKTIEAKKQ